MSIYCWVRRREITDDLVELLIRVVHRMSVRAERKVVLELIRDIRKVRGKTTLLFKSELTTSHRTVLVPATGSRPTVLMARFPTGALA